MGYSYTRGESSYDLIEEGDYEVEIEKASVRQTPNGKENISVQFRIRSDVEQKFQNRVVFDSIWRDKENPNLFNQKKMFRILDACKDIPDTIEFETVDDYIKLITGEKLIIHVSIDDDEWNGQVTQRNGIPYMMPTKHPDKVLGAIKVEAPKDNVETIAVESDDLPF